MVEREELKPCPFCGGKGKLHKYRTFNQEEYGIRDKFYVECEECEEGKNKDLKMSRWGKEEAIEAWNRRADNGR